MDAVTEALPKVEFFEFDTPPEEEGITVEFRLVYRGRLPAASSGTTRAKEKHLIRKQLHQQLRVLWQDHPALRGQLIAPPKEASKVDQIADEFALCGYRFVPLVRKDAGLSCSLNILFLRRDNPGSLVASGGDIDNRIKVLFDALRMPVGRSEMAGFEPGEDENPFFCLLQDDDLITDVAITTDRLLTPKDDEEHVHEVALVIHVNARAIAWHAILRYGF